MKRCILLFIGVAAFAVSLQAAVGDQFDLDGFGYKVTAEGAENTVAITACPCNTDGDGQLVIPATVTHGSPTVTYTVTEFMLDGARYLECAMGGTFAGYESVVLPASIRRMGANDLMTYFHSVKYLHVDANNPYLSSQDGVLFNKRGNKLLLYPRRHGGEYTVPEGTDTIGSSSFQGASLIRIHIPASVRVIETSAFTACTLLSEVHFSEGLLCIGSSAFRDCNSLTQVTLPASLVALDESGAFWTCLGLQRLDVAEGNARYTSVDGVLFNKRENKLLFYPYAKEGNRYAVPDGVDTISQSAFESRLRLKRVSFPASLRVIDDGAFAGCYGLDSICFPVGVREMGSYAFHECVSLQGIVFPDSLEKVGKGVFMNCDLLRRVDLSALVRLKVIGEDMFSWNRNSLRTVLLPPALEEIKTNAFRLTGLQEVNWGDASFTTLSPRVFCECDSLRTVVLPPTCDSIGKEAFMDCESLKEFTNLASTPQPLTIEQMVFRNFDTRNCDLFVLYHSLNLYRTAEVWRDFNIHVLCSITGLPNDSTLGMVLGGGEYLRQGVADTLVAVPRGDAEFVCWMDELGAFAYSDTLPWMVSRNDTVYAMFRSLNASDDATLASLAPSKGQLAPQFDPDVLAYADTVPYAVDNIRLQAVPRHPKALVMRAADTLTHPLQVGHNPLEVVVTAEDLETTATYTVDVYRQNNNANLRTLRIQDAELSPVFTPTHYAYSATLPYGVPALMAEVVPEDPNADVARISNRDESPLHTTMNILVQAEDRDTTRTYTIDVWREEPGGIMTVAGGVLCPNPVRAGVPFDLSVDVPGGRVDVFDGTGRHVLEQPMPDVTASLTIDRKGLYLLCYTPLVGREVVVKLLVE